MPAIAGQAGGIGCSIVSKNPWYKRYGQDFVFGTMGLSLEVRGAYSILIDLMYDRDGPLPDDARYLAGIMGVSTRKWNVIRGTLIEEGKIEAEDGEIFNMRVEKELADRAKHSRERTLSGQKGGRKRAENTANIKRDNAKNTVDINKNNDLAEAELKPVRSQSLEPEKSPPVIPHKNEPDEVQAAVNDWNTAAADLGLATVQKITSARRAACRARLKDCGGLAGWNAVLAKIRGDPFFLGNNDRGWKVDFDFLMRESKFTKLMEGGYEHGTGKPNGKHPTDDELRSRLAGAAAHNLEAERRAAGSGDARAAGQPADGTVAPSGGGGDESNHDDPFGTLFGNAGTERPSDGEVHRAPKEVPSDDFGGCGG